LEEIMSRVTFVLLGILVASPALAQPGRRPPPPPQPPVAQVVDTQGWTLLGEQEVRGRRDRDTITVGRYQGQFDQVQLVVLDSDIELREMTITFTNGERFTPAMKFFFREGQRSKAIDLPGRDRTIATIDLAYGNTPGGGRARVAVYGRDKQPKPLPAVDTQGWTLLGEEKVQGRRDRDTITVGRYQGQFDQVQLVVLDSDIELRDMTITFTNGERFTPAMKFFFREGQRSKAIDLPGRDRTIAKIDLAYSNTRGGGAARVAVYGRDKRGPGPAPVPQPPAAFDSTGWTMLGEHTVDRRRDKDTIKVGKYAGRFDQLSFVVLDSDLELRDFTVVFPGGQRWSPRLKHFFREGARSRVIELPGKDRVIQKIELAYANTPGGGRARVQVFGRDAGRPPPPPLAPITWDNKGWTFLGKTTVDGWRDRDRLQVVHPNGFSEVMFVVAGSDVELRNVVITLGNGERFEMPSTVIFREGTRTAPIDIPGKVRKIKTVDFTYANLPGGGRAQIEVWARLRRTQDVAPVQQQQPPPGPPPGPPPPVRDHRR
jgi:hypothetical protein